VTARSEQGWVIIGPPLFQVLNYRVHCLFGYQKAAAFISLSGDFPVTENPRGTVGHLTLPADYGVLVQLVEF
jgi:hypothetical protein